jgi:hypothetical protein
VTSSALSPASAPSSIASSSEKRRVSSLFCSENAPARWVIANCGAVAVPRFVVMMITPLPAREP